MQAVEISAFGAPEVLRLAQRPMPVAGAGEVLIRVRASGVNRPDVLQRSGAYPPPPGASDLPGLDCVAPVGQCLPVPAGFDDVQAASLPETFFTVWSNVFDRARLQPGETLLIQGGTSGIGVTAIQLAKALGARVIATAGSDEKCAACLALGADHAINYKTQDFSAVARELTDGKGVDVVLDMVAGSYVAREVECLAEDGRLVIIAVQGGVKAEFNAGLVLRRRLVITGSTLRPRPVAWRPR